MTDAKSVLHLVTANHFDWLIDLADEVINTDAKGELRDEYGVLVETALVEALRNSGSNRIKDMRHLSEEAQRQVLHAVAAVCISAEESARSPILDAQNIVREVSKQYNLGWDEDSIMYHLAGFIEDEELCEKLRAYLIEYAEEECSHLPGEGGQS